jgi:hypothetical protein
LYACEICLTQLTKSSYKQRVTHWESRFQAGLSSTCQSCGYIRSSILPIQSEFALEGYYTEKKKSWSTLIFSQRTELMYTYIQSKNWTARFHRNGIRHIHLFSQRTELLGSDETEIDTYIYSVKELNFWVATKRNQTLIFRQRTEKKCHILYTVINQSGIIVFQNNVIWLGAAITS